MNHSLFMSRCIELAKKGGKHTQSNPNVGCVIVHNDKIIGEGYHKKFGGPHAEIEAINSIVNKELLKSSTIYVSLEPCCHTGKTPPCTSMIIAMGIPHVVISTLDPNPQVAGNGVKILRQHGIKVDVGILEHEGKRLLKKFNANLQKRPFIILKIIQSKDGFIGSLDGQVWLSNPFSTLLSHKWRSEADGIMVGTKTVLVDDPTLTTRYWTGENPIRIVWDNQLILKNNLNIFDNSAQTIVLNEKLDLIKNNISFVNIKGKTLTDVLEILYDHKIYSLIIEGGSATIGSFYNAGLWNEARIITVPKSISKTHEKLIESIAIRGHDIESINLLGDHLQIIENAI